MYNDAAIHQPPTALKKMVLRIILHFLKGKLSSDAGMTPYPTKTPGGTCPAWSSRTPEKGEDERPVVEIA